MKIRVIVNPKAGAGRAARTAPDLARAFGDAKANPEISFTDAPGAATRLARAARDDGADIIAVVGGDGTLNEVCQAYIDDKGRFLGGPALGIVPAGTGGDFRKTFGFDEDLHEAVQRIVNGTDKPLDLGLLSLISDDGAALVRAFVNIASFGISGRVDRLVNGSPKWMGGRLAFGLGTLRAMATYKNAPVSIAVDGVPWHEGRIMTTAIANGRYFGGGMQVAPHADPTDGLFDVVVLGDMKLAESVAATPRIYAGTHVDMPRVRSTRGATVEAKSLDGKDVFVDLDGEAPGKLPVRAWIEKGALRLRI